MNKQYKQLKTSSQGFTIIEVVLVLAIAGLIFLMVFIALPALQRGQRDTQRKDDISRVNTQLSNFSSSSRGAVPTQSTLGSFVSKYLGTGATTALTGTEYQDPSGSTNPNGVYSVTYTDSTSIANPNPATIYYSGPSGASSTSGFECDDSSPGDVKVVNGNRKYALRVQLENQAVPYCIDNR